MIKLTAASATANLSKRVFNGKLDSPRQARMGLGVGDFIGRGVVFAIYKKGNLIT